MSCVPFIETFFFKFKIIIYLLGESERDRERTNSHQLLHQPTVGSEILENWGQEPEMGVEPRHYGM